MSGKKWKWISPFEKEGEIRIVFRFLDFERSRILKEHLSKKSRKFRLSMAIEPLTNLSMVIVTLHL